MKPFTRSVLLIVAAVATAVPFAAHAQDAPIFHEETPFGEVWVSTDLAQHRTGMDYIPLVVGVRNEASDAATLTRGSFHLEAPDGRELEMPSLQTLRTNYPKLEFDHTMGRIYGFTGIPFGTRLLERLFIPSSFFPTVLSGETAFDSVELPKDYWTIDMLYFPTPAGLADGREVTLVVESDEWEEPVEVDFKL